MGVALRELLSDPLFEHDLRQLAGASGLENQISHISVIDTPLIPLPLYSLEDDVFVLTSFYLYQNTPDQLLEAVKNLHIMGISALCIKTDLYVPQIPEAVVRFCDSSGLPLFVTAAPGVAFRRIISVVEEHIKAADVAQQNSAIFDSYLRGSAKSAFSKLVTGSDLFNFVCLTGDRKLLVKSIPLSAPALDELLATAEACLDEPELFSAHEDTVMRQGFWCSPCRIRGNLEAVLVLGPGKNAPDHEVRKAARTLTLLLSLQLMEQILTDSGYQQAAAALASDILQTDYPSEDRARQIFCAHGFPNGFPFYRLLLCTGLAGRTQAAPESYFAHKGRQTIVTNTIAATFPSSMCFTMEGQLVAVVPVREDSRYLADPDFDDAAQSALDKLELVPRLELSYSQLQSRLMDAPKVLRHLLVVGRAGPPLAHSRPRLVRDLDPAALAMAAVESGQQELLRSRILLPILQYDRRYNYSLIETLLLCMEAESLEKAAAALYIHTSTLRYRLQKIQQLTGYNFFDFQDRVVLYIACLLWRMREDAS